MKFSVVAAALVSLVPAVLGLTIDTPANVVQCQPVLLNWRDGTAPFFLSFVPAGQPNAAAIKTLPTQQGNQFSYVMDLQANSLFTIVLKDSTGATAFSDIVTVRAGTDSACLTGGSSNGSSPPSTGGSSPTNTATGNPANSSGGSGSSTRTSSTPTPSTGNNASGGVTTLALSSFGVAGVIGAIAALF